jgi:hypothetical protein
MMISNINDNNSIDKELWRIFSYYSIHHNSSMAPNTVTVITFMKFAQDCQILNELNSVIYQLPTLESNHNKSQGQDHDVKSCISLEMKILHLIHLTQQKRHTSSNNKVNQKIITFTEFLDILKSISVLVYPEYTNTRADNVKANMSYRRLLLEHVLLLANRRCDIDLSLEKDLPNVLYIIFLS